MDPYNRFQMRASGEKQHQAASATERIVFGVFDLLIKFKLLGGEWGGKPQNQLMDVMLERVGKILADEKAYHSSITFVVMRYALQSNMINPLWQEMDTIPQIDFLQELAEHIERCNHD